MIKINLLPPKDSKGVAKREVTSSERATLIKLLLPLLVSAVVSAGVYFYVESTKSELTTEIEQNKKTLSNLQSKIQEIKKFEQLNREIEMRTKLIESLIRNQPIPVSVLSSVAKSLPDGVWLTELSFSAPIKSTADQQADRDMSKKVITKGYGLSNLNIVAFVENLKNTKEFENVFLSETEQTEYEKVPVFRFTVELRVRE